MPITSLSGFVTLPELKLNFVINLNEEEPKRNESKVISRILDMASGLPPEMQGIIADFADFLAKRENRTGRTPLKNRIGILLLSIGVLPARRV